MVPEAHLSLCITKLCSMGSSLWILELPDEWDSTVNGCSGLNCGPQNYIHLEYGLICNKGLYRCT